MTAPAVHYRIANEDVGAFTDETSYTSKEEAEAAAAALIIAHGGPAKLYVYALAAQVTVATEATDAAAPG